MYTTKTLNATALECVRILPARCQSHNSPRERDSLGYYGHFFDRARVILIKTICGERSLC